MILSFATTEAMIEVLSFPARYYPLTVLLSQRRSLRKKHTLNPFFFSFTRDQQVKSKFLVRGARQGCARKKDIKRKVKQRFNTSTCPLNQQVFR